MTSFPDPARDGSYRFRAVNNHGKVTSFGITAGPTPEVIIDLPPGVTNFVVKNAQGTPVLTVPPTGYSPPPPTPTVQTVTVSGPITGGVVNVVPPDANDILMTLPPAAANAGRSILIGYKTNGTGAFVEFGPQPGEFIVNNSAPSPNTVAVSENRFFLALSVGTNFWFVSNNL